MEAPMNQHQKPINRDRFPAVQGSQTLDHAAFIDDSLPIGASERPGLAPKRRALPLTTMLLGLGLTAVWVSLLGYLLGYALFVLVGLAI
jgi:hypothetical protein